MRVYSEALQRVLVLKVRHSLTVPMASSAIAVHVVEDHDAALPLIYRAIGSKKIPFSGLGLIHFDSHPDLLSPNVLADECTDKEKLFAFTSIAEWILPAVYMGHISCVVWVKPPWGQQIAEGSHVLHVGKDTTTGQIRVGTPLSYYITELLYVPLEHLHNVRSIPLHVTTLHPLTAAGNDEVASAGDEITGESDSTGTGCSPRGRDGTVEKHEQDGKKGVCGGERGSVQHDSAADEAPPPPKKQKTSIHSNSSLESATSEQCSAEHPDAGHWGPPSPDHTSQDHVHCITKPADLCGVSIAAGCLEDSTRQLCTAITGSKSWILDIDLDFFSTGNPFKSIFTEEQFRCLCDLYQLEEPESLECPASISRCVEKRQLQLDSLRSLWSGGTSQLQVNTERYVHDSPLSSLQVAKEQSHIWCQSEVVKEIQSLIGTEQEGAILEAEDLHLAGMMTDLPEHLSSEEEISGLVVALHQLLHALPPNIPLPSMVTIARSSEDGYTPCSEVDSIQDLVLAVLKQRYGDLHEQLHYLEGYTVYDSCSEQRKESIS